MRLHFGHKIFLAFLANSIIIVICMLLFARHFAHRDFEEYIGRVEIARLEDLTGALSEEYRKTGGWECTIAEWDDWLRLIIVTMGPPGHRAVGRAPLPSRNEPSSPAIGTGRGEKDSPLPGPPVPTGVILPPPFRLSGAPPGPLEFASRVSLFDLHKRSLTGPGKPSSESYQLRPIVVNDELVGYLGLRKPEHLTHPLDLEFISRQSRTFYSIAGVALLLAIFVTFLLSRRLLYPVKKLAEGTRALTSRKFETRIPVHGRDELSQLAGDFNSMAQALERYEAMRRQWIADISHELRTPLSILRCEIEAMQDGVRELTPEALDSLHSEILHLGRIVQDLHDLSLIESENPQDGRTAVKPLELLEEVLKNFHIRFEQRGFRVDAPESFPPVHISADADRLKQLYSNVFENSLLYADAPCELKVRYTIEGGVLGLHFEDTGPGVPEESVGRLFDRLYRVDKARGRSHGGSGLGLAICKSIAERFEGGIEAANVKPSGLRISVLFPVIPAGSATSRIGSGEDPN